MITTPDHTDAASSLPAMEPVGPVPSGFWLDCDPATGRPGTRFRAEEFNELAINLRRFLAASGVLPVKGTPDMLLASLNRLFAGKVTAIVATGALTADNAGLVVIDATSGDVTLTLPDASVLPAGSPAFSFVRADATTHKVRIAPLAGDVIRGGVITLESEPALIRSDGASTWWPLGRMGAPIARAVTLNVNPTGVLEPADPMSGDAFNTLGAAMAWLNKRSIVPPGVVTIQIAAGTYTSTAPVVLGHPNGHLLHIVGAGSATTLLRFNGCNGLEVRGGDVIELRALTLQGDGTTAGAFGIVIEVNEVRVGDDLVVDSFGQTGIYISGALSSGPTGTLTVKNCASCGISVEPASSLTIQTNAVLNLVNNSPAGLAQLFGEAGSSIRVTNLTTSGGNRGLWLANACVAVIGNLTVVDATAPAEAVRVENGSFLGADIDGRAWVARNAAATVFHTFYAVEMGRIDTRNALAAGCKAVTNPAQNTIGNTQSYIATR